LPDRQGNALVVTVLITLALSGLILGALLSTQTELRLSSNQTMQQMAFYLAERGAEESIAYLAALGQPMVGGGDDGSEPVLLFGAKEVGDGYYTAWADPLDSNTGNSTRFLAITVRGTLNGSAVSKAIQVKMGQQNFSRFAYFTDEETLPWGTPIWFSTGDEFFGPVHSNDQLHIHGDPVFHDVVTSSNESIYYYSGGPPNDNPDFQRGVTLGVPEIQMPENLDLLKAKAQEPGGLYFTGNMTEIELYVDEFLSIGKMRVIINNGAEVIHDLPANGVCYVNGDLQLRGTLKGQLTIACKSDMEIMDDVLYYTDPREDPTSTDLLGLIAENNVIMDGDPHGDNVDVGDETIMAAVMALDTSFTVEGWNSGSPRGNLVLYGGLIQRKRGPVGTFNPWTDEIVTGYGKDYSYDPRLMDHPPPFFPTTGEIDKVAWREIDPASEISANFW